MVASVKFSRLLSLPATSFFLFGPRGVGKSTWLKDCLAQATFIDLLREKTYQDLLADIDLFSQRLNTLPPGSWVVVDEIQRLPNLLNDVHWFIEERGLHFALSGSSSRKLRRSGTNLLAGRAIRRDMFPLTPQELGTSFELEKILEFGSLPVIWQQAGSRDVLEAYVQTYLKEEIQAEALVKNLPGFARFLPVAALFHGQVLNAAALGRDAGVARTTIVNYLEILEDTLLAFRLAPFEGRLRVKEKKHPKLYFADPGIARASQRVFGPVPAEARGPLFEGWIAQLLRTYQSYRRAFDDWHYWSPTEAGGLEVDFLLWQGDRCLALEVKASRRYKSEFSKGLRAFADSFGKKLVRQLVVYLGDERLKTAEGVEVYPYQDFIRMLEQDRLFASGADDPP